MGPSMTNFTGPYRVAERGTWSETLKRREQWKVCVFLSCLLSSLDHGKHFYFTHQSIASSHFHRCHLCAIKLKSHKKNHLLSGFVWQSVGLYRSFYDRGGWKFMQITYHTPHTSLKLIFFFQSLCHHWLACVFSNLIWRRVKLPRKN